MPTRGRHNGTRTSNPCNRPGLPAGEVPGPGGEAPWHVGRRRHRPRGAPGMRPKTSLVIGWVSLAEMMDVMQLLVFGEAKL